MIEKIKLLPDNKIRLVGRIAKDGALILCVAMFEKDGWEHWVKIPFSEFSNSCNNLEQLKNILIKEELNNEHKS